MKDFHQQLPIRQHKIFVNADFSPPDAEIRAEMALRNEKVNGESGEGEEDVPEDTIEEEDGEGVKGETNNEENGEQTVSFESLS